MTETTTTEPPTVSAWQSRHRYRLRMACRATPSYRGRTDQPAEVAVLLYLLSRCQPISLQPGEVAVHTGLSHAEVAHAVADLEQAGRLEPGSAKTGRMGLLTPAVLAVFGLEAFGLAADYVRNDVPPAGYAAEQSAEDLAAAFA